MGCHFWNNCNECSKHQNADDTFKEYKILRKMDRIKLHSRYILCISLGIVVWLVATGTYNNKLFPDWVSFASTITSIVLSVIAIIMSITGESKTDAIKNDLSETARKLDTVVNQLNQDMSGTNKDIRDSISQLDEQIKILQDKVDKVPEQVISKYTRNNTSRPYTRNFISKNNMGWGSSVNEK